MGISAILGTTCRKLKILYLQNNIISKMENLRGAARANPHRLGAWRGRGPDRPGEVSGPADASS